MDFILSLTVVLPICIYLILGIIAKQRRWISEEGLSSSNALVYRLFFPFVMFSNVYSSNLTETLNGKLLAFLLTMTIIIFIMLSLTIPIFIKERSVQGSMIQGIFRGNSILFAIPIVSSIYGSEKAGIAAISISFLVPFYNLLCVILLEHKRGTKANLKKVLFSVLNNPIIIGAMLGLVVKVFGIELPFVIEGVVRDMARVVTPFALVLLGACLSISNIQKNRWKLFTVCLMKLIVIPFLFIVTGYFIGFRDIELTTIFGISSVPTAVSSYVMAKEMDADGELAGEIVALTSIGSIVTVFLWVLLLTGMGWIQQ